MEQIDVSIIIPVYNAETYLPECLDSVARQTIARKEVICIDDGSTDDSWKILEQYAAKYPWIRIYQQENQGPGPARNKGIAKALGRFVTFLDADDWYLDAHSLEFMVSEADRLHVKACAGMRQICEYGRVKPSPHFRTLLGNDEKGRVVSFEAFQSDYDYQQYIFDREMLIEYAIQFPSLRRYQDPPFLFRTLLAAVSVAFCPVEFYCIRIGHQNVAWLSSKIGDTLRGIQANMALAKQLGYKMLQRRTIERMNHEFYKFIEENLNPGILKQLEEINALRIVEDEIRSWEEIFHDSHEEWALNDFIYLKQHGWDVANELQEQGIQKIAIYGLGNFGDIFYNEIKDSNLEIVAVIDRDKVGDWHGMPIRRPQNELPLCDAVMITPFRWKGIVASIKDVYAVKMVCFRVLLEEASQKQRQREGCI